MKDFLILYMAPVAVVDEWRKKPAEERKPEEEKMMTEWKAWMSKNAQRFSNKGAGVGKTKRVTAQGPSDVRNDVMLYAVVQAESHDQAAQLFVGHPHLQIPQASIEIMETSPLPPA